MKRKWSCEVFEPQQWGAPKTYRLKLICGEHSIFCELTDNDVYSSLYPNQMIEYKLHQMNHHLQQKIFPLTRSR